MCVEEFKLIFCKIFTGSSQNILWHIGKIEEEVIRFFDDIEILKKIKSLKRWRKKRENVMERCTFVLVQYVSYINIYKKTVFQTLNVYWICMKNVLYSCRNILEKVLLSNEQLIELSKSNNVIVYSKLSKKIAKNILKSSFIQKRCIETISI